MRKKYIYTAFRDPIYFPFNIDRFRKLLNFIKLTTHWKRLLFLFQSSIHRFLLQLKRYLSRIESIHASSYDV